MLTTFSPRPYVRRLSWGASAWDRHLPASIEITP
jgi:hypothetical protein